MPRNIVVCCDGTCNEHSESNTNVGYFFEAVDRDDPGQVAFYDAGVGTFGPFGWRLDKSFGKLLGAAFGYGLKQNVEHAYRFLMDHYVEGDRVFLVGFSRGAFAARSLASMLHKCGLLYPSHVNLVPYASQKYFGNAGAVEAAEFKRVFCRECRPVFVGVWDTVGSLGWLLALRQFHDARLSPDVAHAYHAVAIDEWRPKFVPSLWDEGVIEPHQHVRQVWFAGVHSDVGGGFPQQRGLGDVTLTWMLDRAEAHGLRTRASVRATLAPDPGAPMNRNKPLWRLLGSRERSIPADAEIHGSVRERVAAGIGYDPGNLPAGTGPR